ncbi:MAG: 5'/3'-nucleotidase SurE [Haloarculaceae archaeon]
MGDRHRDLQILLTNDDGIDAPGLDALHEALARVGDVTVVAPAVDHSGIGRVLSYGRPVPLRTGAVTDEMGIDSETFTYDLDYEERESGYAVEGTPCDCVVVGVNALDERPDVVVSGCNPGANVGVSALDRSGTVSAAMEAAFLGVPGVAVSAHGADEADPATFDAPARFAADLLDHVVEAAVFDRADYLNVLVPAADPDGVRVTRPADDYEMGSTREDGRFRVHHRTMARSHGDPADPGPADTDRHAIHGGHASVTPLALPRTPCEVPELDAFAEQYGRQ